MGRKPKSPSDPEERLRVARARIQRGTQLVRESVLGALLREASVVECRPTESDAVVSMVDCASGAVWVNPHARARLDEREWAHAIGHQLLHLALGHGPRRAGRDALAWNVACEHAVDLLLAQLGVGRAPEGAGGDARFLGATEDEIYAALARERGSHARMGTYAGAHRADLLRGDTDLAAERAPAWEARLAEGIRDGVERAVERAADALSDQPSRPGRWAPALRAQRQVTNDLPLLGALSAQLRVVADAGVCKSMGIAVAAVNPLLGEVYLNPTWDFADAELVFVYAHELLHVALMHHARAKGRDARVWNLACDFVINGWLVEMGVGRMPRVGAPFDPRLAGKSAEEVYDLLAGDPRRCRGLRGFRGELGDVLLDGPRAVVFRGEACTLDDVYRRCLEQGLACPWRSRGHAPAGLVEEIRALFTPPVPWDVALARWMDAHVPVLRDPRRSYARASRRQASTPDIPRPARCVPQEELDAHTFGVVLDTSGSMDRALLGRALGAIASYAEARDVPRVRVVLCDAAPHDRGYVSPADLRGVYPVTGRGGTALQPAIAWLLGRGDFPATAPVMVLTDGHCEERLVCPREHCFVLPRKQKGEHVPLQSTAPMFRVLKEASGADEETG